MLDFLVEFGFRACGSSNAAARRAKRSVSGIVPSPAGRPGKRILAATLHRPEWRAYTPPSGGVADDASAGGTTEGVPASRAGGVLAVGSVHGPLGGPHGLRGRPSPGPGRRDRSRREPGQGPRRHHHRRGGHRPLHRQPVPDRRSHRGLHPDRGGRHRDVRLRGPPRGNAAGRGLPAGDGHRPGGDPDRGHAAGGHHRLRHRDGADHLHRTDRALPGARRFGACPRPRRRRALPLLPVHHRGA